MAYTTIDDPSAHCQGLNHIGTGSAHKISYDGHADSYIPDIFFIDQQADGPIHYQINIIAALYIQRLFTYKKSISSSMNLISFNIK